jgi:CheY-like chemotaxis protein
MRLTVHTALTDALEALIEASGGNDPYRIALIGKDSLELDADIVALSLQNDPVFRSLLLIRIDDLPSAMRCDSKLFWKVLNLPCRSEDLAAVLAGGQTRVAPLRALAGCKALVVDDDAASRLAALKLLEARGCLAEQAANGAEACAMLEDGAYDLILMDVEMPVLDGKRATRRIRARHRDAGNTKSSTLASPQPIIVAVTSSAAPTERQECLDAGMNDFIAKPLQASTLERHLAWWFKTDSSFHPTAKLMKSLAPHDKQQYEYDRLAEVREEFGPVFAELANLYRQDSPTRIDAMRREFATGNNTALAKFAHALGGSSASIGASGLADQCRELEILARVSLPDDAAARIDAIARAYQRIAGKLDNMSR